MKNLFQQRWLLRLRGHVEQEIRKILHDRYELDVDSTTPIRYYLDFKSDQRLLELRDTLERIESGKFGFCLLCGEPIELRLLHCSPASQFCATCTGGLQVSSRAHREEIVTARRETILSSQGNGR